MTVTVYRVTCISTRESYIGSTRQAVGRRWTEHRRDLRAGKHRNHRLQAAWALHGEGAFTFAALAECEESVRQAVEQSWITATPGAVNVYSPVARSRNQRNADRVDARVRAILGVDWLRKLRSSPAGQAAQEPSTGGMIEP